MVPLDAESFATPGHDAGAVSHQESGVDPVTNRSRRSGDRGNVDPVLDDELQAGVADELGGCFDADRPDAFYLTQLA